MAISPPSDIVLDVARAAEPAEIAAARAALTKKAGGAAAPFSVGAPPLTRDSAAAAETDRTSATQYRRFEAMVLQTFIQTMLPKDAEGIYGKGLAGDMWKAQLSERMADAMAARGGIGIADRMLANHYPEGRPAAPSGPVSKRPERVELDRQESLSTSLVQQIERRIIRSLEDEPAAATAGKTG